MRTIIRKVGNFRKIYFDQHIEHSGVVELVNEMGFRVLHVQYYNTKHESWTEVTAEKKR